MKNVFSSVRGRAAALVAVASAIAYAPAQAAGIDALFEEVDLSGVALKIAALSVVIVGIAMTLKGPDIVKRIIKKA